MLDSHTVPMFHAISTTAVSGSRGTLLNFSFPPSVSSSPLRTNNVSTLYTRGCFVKVTTVLY